MDRLPKALHGKACGPWPNDVPWFRNSTGICYLLGIDDNARGGAKVPSGIRSCYSFTPRTARCFHVSTVFSRLFLFCFSVP